jgi:uncharacterized protein YndB with AHSA1/START domain
MELKLSGDIVIENSYDVPVTKVWSAISDRRQMKEWYFDLAEFRAVPGFRFSFLAGDENQKWLHLCEVREVIPDKKLSYTWKYDGYAGNSIVIFELEEVGGRTVVRLTHRGLETFPREVEAFKRDNFVTGWTQIMGENLKKFLEKTGN